MKKRCVCIALLVTVLGSCAMTAYADNGFDQAWVDPAVNLKDYEVIYIEKVDTSSLALGDAVKQRLGDEMRKRFACVLCALMPTVVNEREIGGRRALSLKLKITEAVKANVTQNVAVTILNPLPVDFLGLSSQGVVAFEGVIVDRSTGVKVIAIQDRTDEDKNSSLIGVEDFGPWQHAYNIMEGWADSLALLLAESRGQEYKPVSGHTIL